MANSTGSSNGTSAAARFGTFDGVFTPNILTILGIILFLRLGWVVGQVGLFGALAIVLLANAISLLTGLSLSSVATNMRVRAGGNYYLISRSLGLEIGGAIGIPLYLSQAISVAFYIIGFTEALLAIEFFRGIDPRLIATSVTLAFILISYIGADFALKIQFFILLVLMASLGSFFIGGLDLSNDNYVFIGSMDSIFRDSPVLTSSLSENVSFWVVFAVFFPAVTGIEVGVSLSGDLKNPSFSIPVGTIVSILFTALIYIIAVVFFAMNETRGNLLSNNLAMQNIAVVPALILAGVWASTLSSALGSVLAAPRTLQAIARDNVVPKWMASQMGSATEPRMAVLLTGVIAVGVIWMGDLDVVAPVISMFFLNTYGMVNLAAAIEKVVANPSYRPRFDVPWWVSVFGALGCYGAMFLINPIATVIAIIISGGVFFVLERRGLQRTWGDVRSGIWFALSRYALINLESMGVDSKNWRPNLIVFTGQPHNREQLVQVADWLSLGRGIVTFFQFIIGEVDHESELLMRKTARKHIRGFIEENQMKAFAEVEIVKSFNDGAVMVAQAHGIGAIEANSILMGWSREPGGRQKQMHLMHDLVGLRKSVLFLNYDRERGFGNYRVMNVWWQGRGGNEDLMLLIAHLIEDHGRWRGATVRLMRVVDNSAAIEQTRQHMQTTLASARVDAEPVIIVRDSPDTPINEIIKKNSVDADLSILGMQVFDDYDEREAYADRLHTLATAVGTVLLVRNAELDTDLLNSDD